MAFVGITCPYNGIFYLAKGRAMSQVVSRRPFAEEARLLFQVSMCGFCGG